MVQVPILSGICGKRSADFERSYPVNMTPIAEAGDGTGTGISKGYLRLVPGFESKATTSAQDRGGVVFQGAHYRAIGPRLVAVAPDGGLTDLGDIGGTEPVTFAQSFDRLAVASGGNLYYLVGGALVQVTDPDLGPSLSATWLDGYFLSTDGTSIVATELNDPASIDPIKYGSSEADPDPIVGLLTLRGDLYALNGTTIEVFSNGGSTGFPFRRQRGAQIPKGCVGASAFALFVETFAFCGAGHNEGPAVYLAGAGQGIRISPRALDEALQALPASDLALIEMESRQGGGLTELYVRLPTETWVYHWTASQQFDAPVWSRIAGRSHDVRHFTLADGAWWAGDATMIGVMDAMRADVAGDPIQFQFDTPLIYNGGRGALVHEMELVPIAGRGGATAVMMSYTDDGRVWSDERACSTGGVGDRKARMRWRRAGRVRHWRGFRFRGAAHAPIGFTRLEAQIEALDG